MSGTAYTIDLDDPTDHGEDSVPSMDQGLQSPGSIEENAQDSDDHVGFAWQIDFTSSASTSSKPKKQLPKFLRDREKARVEKMNKEASKKMTHPSTDTKAPTRTLSETRREERKSATPPTRSRTPLPLKAKSVPEVSLSARPARNKDKRPFSSPTNRTQTSPKKSPPIKQPLLAVKSPQRGQSSLLKTSTSNSSILLRSPRRTKSATPSLSPRKAKDITAKQKSVSAVKDTQSSLNERSSNTVGSSGKKGRASSVQRQLLTVEIPTGSDADTQPIPKMAVEQQEIEQRKVLDLKRWYCMCRPQYSKSCGISSVVSCWNYLFSTLGNGRHRPVTQEEALTLLGFKPPFGEIRFGPFTGNATCMRWFQGLCCHYGVCGQAYYFYKPVGKGKTFGLKPKLALQRLKDGLRDPSMAFVYHCLNHYFCPIGYEDVPKMAQDAYKFDLPDEDIDTWVLIGEPSRKQSSIHCKRWLDIVTDLSTKRPEFFNIRHTERGVQSKKTKRSGGNLHCIMAFKKLDDTSPDFFVGPEILSEPQELQLSLSEVENLDSSDSDFPLSPKSSENSQLLMGTDVPDADSEAIEAMNAFRVELGGKKVGQSIKIPTQDLVYESVDTPEVFRDLDVTSNESNVPLVVGTIEHDQPNVPSVASQVKHSLMPIDAPTQHNNQTNSLETTSEDICTEHNSVLYPNQSSPKLRSSTYIKQRVPALEVKESDSDSESPNSHQASPSSIRRSGTFTKELNDSKPIIIRKIRPPSESDQVKESDSENESSNHHQVSPSTIRRSGTFTKEPNDSKPIHVIIRKTRPPSEYSSDQDSEQDFADDGSSDAIRRSDTFLKPGKFSSILQAQGKDILDLDVTDANNEPQSGSSLRRSGTFTKEKPDVIVTRAYDSESSGSEEIDTVASKPHDKLELNTDYLTRSGTYTKQKPANSQLTKEKPDVIVTRAYDSESSCSEEIDTVASKPHDKLELNTDYLTRSRTYTKQKPADSQHCESDSSFEFEYFDGVDLDETLRAPTVESDEEVTVEETLLLPTEQDSYLKRSGTYTKHKPFLDV